MKTWFEVRFVLYQYNSGKADNGYYDFSEKFDTLEKAQQFERKVKRLCQKDHSHSSGVFADKYVYAGFVHSVRGIYKLSEEKIV